jgi:glycerol-3-phosphate dehydrogenase
MKTYKTVVVGGGIVGAGIFRDLTLNGVETLLIEKKDFSSQTSERSSKMLHGGIRYLENLDFALVFEALHEKNLWLKIAPHLARESAFYLPVYKDAKRPLWMITLGLFLYDFLSSFKNSPFKIRNTKEVLQDIPGLKATGLTGAGVYYDGIMDDAKITLEVIYDALKEPHASAMNYTEVFKTELNSDRTILHCRNTLTNEEFKIEAQKVVYALGPFTDQFLNAHSIYKWKNILLPSKGSHLWISAKDLPLTHPIVMTPKSQGKDDDRVIFVIPHGDQILVGTTEVPTEENFFDVSPTPAEINYLLEALNDYFPDLRLNHSHILSSFAGIRPLVKEGSDSDRGKTSREHKIFQPLANTYVIAGGKYTTFRVMGQEITREICHKFGHSYNEDLSLMPLRQKSVVLPFHWKLPTQTELTAICETEAPRTFQDLVQRRLGISSKKIWDERNPGVSFNDYFLSNLVLLKRYIQLSEQEILNFK